MAHREFQKNSRETVRITPTVYEGHELIDVRVYAKNRETGELGPTKKGVAINVDLVPDLIDALVWALGQDCGAGQAAAERQLPAGGLEELADVAWRILRKHGSAVHWDSAERMILGSAPGFSKWNLHYVLATRPDLFLREGGATYSAKKLDET